jgi:hypothetical protein
MHTVHLPETAALAIFGAAAGEIVFGRAEQVADGLHVIAHKVFDKVGLEHGGRHDLLQWADGSALVEAHAHLPGIAACMSGIDLDGLAAWVPHVRWRLGGAPYAALVSAGHTIDGMAWTAPSGEAEAITYIAAGEQRLRTTGRSLTRLRMEANHG